MSCQFEKIRAGCLFGEEETDEMNIDSIIEQANERQAELWVAIHLIATITNSDFKDILRDVKKKAREGWKPETFYAGGLQ